MQLTPLIKVFVYGTLKPGEVNYKICQQYVVDSQPAIAQGKLYHLPFGYPAMTLEGTDSIQGFVLFFDTLKVLSILDEFEQHDPNLFRRFAPHASLTTNQYHRETIKVLIPKQATFDTAWGYIMTSEQIHHLNGTLVANGQWNQQTL